LAFGKRVGDDSPRDPCNGGPAGLLRLPVVGDNVAMQAEPSKAELPKRRWFQFSLRTLLIGVTLLAVPLGYVGWQAKIVRERQAWIANPEPIKRELKFQEDWFAAHKTDKDPGEILHGEVRFLTLPETAKVLTDGRSRDSGPSFIRRWLGDKRYDQIGIDAPANEDEIRRAVELFPESLIILFEHH
jgi:hypothetical protein